MSIDVLVFTIIENEVFVGTNSTTSGNAIKSDIPSIPEEIIIPSHYNGTEITQIGQWSFTNLINITKVYIYAPIKIIHYYAFFGCLHLSYINIPKTCEELRQSAIDGRYGNEPNDTYNNEFLRIDFEPGSQLKYIAQAGISNYRDLTLYTYDKLDTIQFDGYVFDSHVEGFRTTIYSPYLYKLNNIQTRLFQHITCKQTIHLFNHYAFAISLIFS